jgi:pimeloyl-ACP methyl ester carboxylesterase
MVSLRRQAFEEPARPCVDGLSFVRSGVENPQKAPFVLIHGAGLRAEMWSAQLDALSVDRLVFAVDLPGHGHSVRLASPAPVLANFTESVAAFIREVVGAPSIIVGHAMGATIALDLAFHAPRLCRGAGALATIFRRTPTAKLQVSRRAGAMQARQIDDVSTNPIQCWFGEDRWESDDAAAAIQCESWLRSNDGVGYAAAYSVFASEDGPSNELLGALNSPTLFLAAQNDENSTPAMAAAMASLAPAGQAGTIVNARHMFPMTHSAETSDALRLLAQRVDAF